MSPTSHPITRARTLTVNLIEGVRSLQAGLPRMEGLELRHVRRMLQPMLDAVAAELPLSGVLAFGNAGAAQRSAGSAVVTATMALRLGCDRQAVSDLATAALLTSCFPSRDTEDWRRLARVLPLSPGALTVLRAAHADRHASAHDGMVVAVASELVSALARAGAHAAGPAPSWVLTQVLASRAANTPPALLAALVRAVGIHPPGQVVALDDGAPALVLAASSDPEHPWVRMPVSDSGAILRLPELRSITRALPRGQWPNEGTSAQAA